MRYLTRRCPELRGIVLVESGSRPILEAVIPRLEAAFGPATPIHLITCHPEPPASASGLSKVWRTRDYTNPAARRALLAELHASGATVLATLCSGQPIMTRWKWWLAWRLPMKVLIVNENADFFWLDSSNWAVIRRMALVRSGWAQGEAAGDLFRLALAPFWASYLIFYATIVHARRALRVSRRTRTDQRTEQ